MSLSANIFCFLIVGGVFVALFWPWDKTKKKPTTHEKQVMKLKNYISNLQLENEELRELIHSAMKTKS